MKRSQLTIGGLLGFALAAASFHGSALASGDEDAGHSARYRAMAEQLLDRMSPGVDPQALLPGARELMQAGAAMVPAFVARHPHCEAYLEAALGVVDALPAMNIETIERDYHADAALPETENVAVCYHMKDLFVHPASVVAILRDQPSDLAHARHEIEEVLAHLGVVDASAAPPVTPKPR